MSIKKSTLIVILFLSVFHSAFPCTVPVFRYALERWAADYHIVTVSSKLDIPIEELNMRHHANLWIQKATSRQSSEVLITYPGSDMVWYEGDWDPSLPDRLSDSPLRREIAKELLSGTTASWIFLEGSDSQSNTATYHEIGQLLELLSDQIKLVESPDYEDELDGYAGPGGPLSAIPLKVDFSLHKLSRNNQDENLLIRQLTAAMDESGSPDAIVAAVIFGQGRMILLSENDLTPEIVKEVCYFLTGECSCRIKVQNPGVDMLMAINWNESIIWYPEPVMTYLPSGAAFLLSDSIPLSETIEPETLADESSQKEQSIPSVLIEDLSSDAKWQLSTIIIFALIPVALLILIVGLFRFRKRRAGAVRNTNR